MFEHRECAYFFCPERSPLLILCYHAYPSQANKDACDIDSRQQEKVDYYELLVNAEREGRVVGWYRIQTYQDVSLRIVMETVVHEQVADVRSMVGTGSESQSQSLVCSCRRSDKSTAEDENRNDSKTRRQDAPPPVLYIGREITRGPVFLPTTPDGRPIGGSTFQAWCGGRIALKIRQRFFERKQATAMEDVYISKYNPGAEEFFKEVRDYAKRRRVAKKDLPTAFPKLAEEAWEMPTLEDSTEGFEQKARHFLLYLDKRTHSSELNPDREKLHDELKTALEHQMRESASALIVHIYSRTPRPFPRFLLRIY